MGAGKGPKTFGEQVDNIVHTAEAGVVGKVVAEVHVQCVLFDR